MIFITKLKFPQKLNEFLLIQDTKNNEYIYKVYEEGFINSRPKIVWSTKKEDLGDMPLKDIVRTKIYRLFSEWVDKNTKLINVDFEEEEMENDLTDDELEDDFDIHDEVKLIGVFSSKL